MTNKSLAFGLKLVVTILGFSVFMNSAECKRPAKAPAVTAITLKSITIESVTVEATADDKDVAQKAAADRAQADYLRHFPRYRKTRMPFKMNTIDTVNKNGSFTCRVTLEPA